MEKAQRGIWPVGSVSGRSTGERKAMGIVSAKDGFDGG
jgi:hypothetical protein